MFFPILKAQSTKSLTRSVGYLHAQPKRVRGLVRDPATFLQSPCGKAYDIQSTSSLKTYLGEEYALDDNLLLQVLTHKSFAHGMKPFNEKLSVHGSQFLKHKSAIHTVNSEKGISALGSLESRKTLSTDILAAFVKQQGFADVIYWKKRDDSITDPTQSGENSIKAGVLEALIGALLVTRGAGVAEKFVFEKLLSENSKDSLVNIVRAQA
ncbi:hypothetical protein WICPIJ_002625 [Wickerhamomyces pijperi]|uniref:RNase III domain-containing protein n=1 Tax=Wickerhamomyces pijperi TaxID=599730 RepID=A0A9P8QB78_WICPI|nr:hypothetical protein WICPIJ_002625 [Wickerhamomyces pijperi]